MKKEFMKFRQEEGNALFLILIAVALFAALSYAVTQSGRGGGNVNKETAMIAASQITQYPASIRTAVTRMMITGSSAASIDFTDPAPDTSAEDEVFNTDGGGVISQDPPSASGATAWAFTDADDGFFIFGIGTDTATGDDAFAYLDDVTLTVCEQINKGLGLASTPLVESTAVDFASGGGGAAVGGENDDSFEVWGNAAGANDPQAFACVRNGAAGNYIYYHAIIEQ